MKPSSFNFIPVKELEEQVNRDFQTTIQYQFDCLARKVMIRTQSSCRRSAGRKFRKECLFSELPEEKRNILLMFYFLEMSDAEIALELGKDRSTIYRSRTSALAALKKRLEGEDL